MIQKIRYFILFIESKKMNTNLSIGVVLEVKTLDLFFSYQVNDL